ncbi:MAG TPA: efflux RND transporter periplasmic adaptor subunit [Armatimonadota bacterium]|jgi:HlyD family secretion protein
MKRWIAIVIPVAVLLGLVGWRLEQKTAAAADQAKSRDQRKNAPVPVTTVSATRRDIVQRFESIGNVESPFNVKIAPKTTGRLTFLEVREGDRVTQGQVLARIDTAEIEAQVRQQQAQVAEARYRLAQAKITQSPNNVSVHSQLSQQEAVLAGARAAYAQAASNDSAQRQAAEAAVADAQGKVNSAVASVANAQAMVGSADANLANARSKFNRMNDLYKQGFTAAQDVDDARTTVTVQEGAVEVAKGGLNVAKAQLDSARAQLNSAQQQARIVATKGKTDIVAAAAQVKQAKATLATARANVVQEPAYRQNLAALQATVDASVAQLRSAQAQLSDAVLISPVSGYVTGRYLDPGAMASPTTPILAVQAVRQVFVSVPAPEEVATRMALGDHGTVRIDALPGKTFVGKVTQINAAADPTSRQFTVRLVVDNPTGLLKPGMFARASIVTRRIKDALVLPREAVTIGPDGATVTVVNDDVASIRPITTGASDSSGISIDSGLQAGEKVVVMSAAPLRDGQKVRIGAGKGGGKGRRGPIGGRG